MYRSLHVDGRLARDLLEDVAETASGLRRRQTDELALLDPVLTGPEVNASVRQFCRVATDIVSCLPDREAALLWMFRTIARAAQYGVPDTPTSKPETQLVRAARDYIHAHLHDEGLSVSRIAVSCNSTRSHLTRAFRDATGLPPHAYINLQRVQVARGLIAEGAPAASVAPTVGFVDQSHLIRRFKGVYGVTPGQFLAAHGLERQLGGGRLVRQR